MDSEVASPAVAPDSPRPGPADITAVGTVSSITICQRVLALHLESPDAGRSQGHVGYASCRGNGFDDGVAVRELTRDACLPLWGEVLELTAARTRSSCVATTTCPAGNRPDSLGCAA